VYASFYANATGWTCRDSGFVQVAFLDFILQSGLSDQLRPVMPFFFVVQNASEKFLFDNRTVSERFHDLNQTAMQFLLGDLDLALTFIEVAEVSGLQDTKDRNYKNARKAYDTALHLLEKLKPDAGQRQVIDAKLARLKTRLEAAGQQF
jgi:hypothetical protein